MNSIFSFYYFIYYFICHTILFASSQLVKVPAVSANPQIRIQIIVILAIESHCEKSIRDFHTQQIKTPTKKKFF